MPALLMPNVYEPLVVDFHAEKQRLYWTDGDSQYRQRGIHSASLNATNLEIIIDSSRNPIYAIF